MLKTNMDISDSDFVVSEHIDGEGEKSVLVPSHPMWKEVNTKFCDKRYIRA
jgi:hypothetical protein